MFTLTWNSSQFSAALGLRGDEKCITIPENLLAWLGTLVPVTVSDLLECKLPHLERSQPEFLAQAIGLESPQMQVLYLRWNAEDGAVVFGLPRALARHWMSQVKIEHAADCEAVYRVQAWRKGVCALALTYAFTTLLAGVWLLGSTYLIPNQADASIRPSTLHSPTDSALKQQARSKARFNAALNELWTIPDGAAWTAGDWDARSNQQRLTAVGSNLSDLMGFAGERHFALRSSEKISASEWQLQLEKGGRRP